jgi:hypothetical protein
MPFRFNPFTGNLDEVDTTAAAGSDTQIQYNDNGSLAGSADLSWDDSTNVLGVGGDINLDDGGTYKTTLQIVTPATADRTITFPDATGTVGLVAGSSGNLVVNQSGAYAGVANSSVDNATGNITLGSRFISSFNGALSATGIAGVPAALTGTWIATGGTATTTKPQFLIEPAGTTSTAWSTAGTGLGINATSGFTGRLLDAQVNGTSRMVLTGAGRLGVGIASPAGELHVAGASANADIFITEGSTNTEARFRNSNGVLVIDADVNNENGASAVIFGVDGSERVRLDASGRLLVGTATNTGGALFQVNGDRFRIATAKTPASATATGAQGEISWDADYIYVCTATDTWKRAALSTW